MPLSRWQPPVLRRDAEDAEQVTWLELFFDLVFVASLIQLGNALSDDVSWEGAVRFGALFVVLWWNWVGTTFFVNRVAVDDWQHRVLVVLQMFAVGSLAVQVPGAFDDRAVGFAWSYVFARVLLVAMYVRGKHRVPEIKDVADLYVGVFGLGIALWALSTVLPDELRVATWAVAVVIELGAPLARRVRHSQEEAVPHVEHMQERFALFTIIVLGEGFVKAVDELADIGSSFVSQVLGLLGLAIAVALWWTYFDDVADARITGRAEGERPRILSWVYLHLPLTGAVTAFGVALKKLVAAESLSEPLSSNYSALLAGSVAVALLAAAGLDRVTMTMHFAVDNRHRVLPRLVASATLVIGWFLLRGTGALVFAAFVAVVAVAQILVEVRVAVRADRWVQERVQAQVHTGATTCEHLVDLPRRTAERLACEPCEEEGVAWVELRLCLACGEVGCCDDSAGQHASAHHAETGHPVMRTLERGDRWAWCSLDETSVDDWREHAAPASSGAS